MSGYTVRTTACAHTATGTATGVLGEALSADLDLTATTHTAAGSLPDRRLDLPRPGRQLRRRQWHGHRHDQRGRPHDHRQQPDQALRHDVHLRRHRVHGHRPPGHRQRHLGHPHQHRRSGHGHRRRQPLPDRPLRRRRHRSRQLHDHLPATARSRSPRPARSSSCRPDYTVPYDGLPHTATGTATGVLGEAPRRPMLDLTRHDPHRGRRSYPSTPGPSTTRPATTSTPTARSPTRSRAAALTITASDQTKPYGTTFTFAGTEFTATGLQGTDSVTSVTLTSAGAPATATVAGSPYPIVPSAAVGTGLANYTITLRAGLAHRHPGQRGHRRVRLHRPVRRPAPHRDRTATGVLGEALSADLDLTATTHTAVGVTVDAWTFHDPAGNYVDASGTVTDTISAAALTITADDQTKPYGTTFTFAGTEFTVTGLQGTDTRRPRSPSTSAGAPATATVAGSPYADRPLGRRRHRPRQLHDQLRQRATSTVTPADPDDHRRRPDQAERVSISSSPARSSRRPAW